MKAINTAIFSLLLMLFITVEAQGIEVFLWEHDNRIAQRDPVFNADMYSTEALARTLALLEDVHYTRNTVLPNDLSSYDVVMTSLSYYCPG